MQQASSPSVTIPVPEPELTPREMIARAEALRPTLLDRQEETERGTYYPQSTHQDFLRAGFYRILQPRRFGGYEFDIPTFYKVIMEISRGCPSTGWCLCLASGHVLQVASLFGERAQAEVFAPDGDFRAASFASPVGVAAPEGGPDGEAGGRTYRLDGTWPYSSGVPYSTHYMGQTLGAPRSPDERPGPILLFVVPASEWTMLDDWYGVLGLRGSGSQSVRMEGGRVRSHHLVPESLLDIDPTGGTVGSRLHGNPMYAGRALNVFLAEIGAIMVGAAKAALDEYQHIITTRPATWYPQFKRYELHDYQRYLGLAAGKIESAEAVIIQAGERYMELCRRGVEEDVPFTLEDDLLVGQMGLNAARMAWDTVQDILFRTGGSGGARDGARMQRYFRDMATCWSHNSLAQDQNLARRLGLLRLGLPLDDPA